MNTPCKNKILLIEPPFYRLFHDKYSLNKYPLSLGYLAGTIRKHTDWDVMVYNADFMPKSVSMRISHLTGAGFTNYRNALKNASASIWDEVRTTILNYRPNVVGITSKTPNFESASIVAKIAKEIDNKTIVITGGPHPSIMSSDILNRKEFDIGVNGEGEETMVELLKTIYNKPGWKGVPGIYYRDNGEVVNTVPRQYIEDLDSLCFPAESAESSLKDYHKYHNNVFRYVFAIRGCPYNCWFCGSRHVWSRKARFRSPQSVVEEIKLLNKRGIYYVEFDDDTFGINKKYILELCSHLAKYTPKTTWRCEINIKSVEDDIIQCMKDSGCEFITLGIESGNNGILAKIRKGITVEEVLRACAIIKKHKIGLGAFFMVGFPWETEETLKDTLNIIKKVNADETIYSIFMPYPGTEAFEYCKEKGLIPENFDSSSYSHQSPENCFCLNIAHDKFRMLVSEIERETDKINSRNNKKLVFNKIKKMSLEEMISCVREFGIKKIIEKILK